MTTRQTLKEKQRHEREELILQAAEEVFALKGYHETSMDEIAARVGVAKGTVYLHFTSKEDLVVALFQRPMQAFIDTIDVPLSSDLTVQTQLEAIIKFMFGSYFSKRAQLLYTIYSNEDLRRIFLEKKGCLNDLWEHLSARVTLLLEKGKELGEFDQNVPTVIMLGTFFSLLSPKIYERLIVQEKIPTDELVKHLSHFFFKGIAAS